MATTFAYDANQNVLQPPLVANEQIFLNAFQDTTIAAGSNNVSVTTFTGTQSLNVISTAEINLLNTPNQNFWNYINGINASQDINLSPSDVDGFLTVATSAGTALLAYQGITSTYFTNVTYITGQPGTLITGGAVTNASQAYYIETGVASRIAGSIFSDQAGSLAILQSFDGVNWDIGNVIEVTANTVNAGINQETIAPFLTFLYSNGATAQDVFRFHVRVFGNGRQGA